ncbi:hypothetical protein FHW88_002143 [Mucilaginibacter sp. SG538B]|nr:hypothetical protein [Mucilaginibacter sp. SG538B]GGB26672.1 hypothetical protein GCM10011500_48710 [Mucilaginibacter rubeus]SCW69669.1 hypothetical protein SAMN03159284_03141 [Mucilaginibacter sp. NFR10]
MLIDYANLVAVALAVAAIVAASLIVAVTVIVETSYYRLRLCFWIFILQLKIAAAAYYTCH